MSRRLQVYAKAAAALLGAIAAALTALPADASWQKITAAVAVAAAGSVLVWFAPYRSTRRPAPVPPRPRPPRPPR